MRHASLMDCILKRKEVTDERAGVEIALDVARGVTYLHNNGVLHRDIKPDNVLVFSLDEELVANGKLTDFGSLPNIDLLMTNMTFTKGVGTPVNMALEVLDNEKYKKPPGRLQFAVTMFECFKWGEAFQRSQFKLPLQFTASVLAVKPVERSEEMSSESVPDAIETTTPPCHLVHLNLNQSFLIF